MEEDRLLKLWEGLGYYNRARNLKKAAQIVTENYGGRMPEDYEAILSLPGLAAIQQVQLRPLLLEKHILR